MSLAEWEPGISSAPTGGMPAVHPSPQEVDETPPLEPAPAPAISSGTTATATTAQAAIWESLGVDGQLMGKHI